MSNVFKSWQFMKVEGLNLDNSCTVKGCPALNGPLCPPLVATTGYQWVYWLLLISLAWVRPSSGIVLCCNCTSLIITTKYYKL